MKRTSILWFFVLLTLLPMQAQNTSKKKSGKSKTVGTVLTDFWNKTKKEVSNAGTSISDQFTLGHSGEIKVHGTYYMPLYSVNLYKGTDGEALRDSCLTIFNKHYPMAFVETCVLPQQQWLSEPVEKKGQIVGYLQTMYCYLVARDGADGYINTKFMFQRYKDVGGTAQPMIEKWPELVRTDVIPMRDYEKLKTR